MKKTIAAIGYATITYAAESGYTYGNIKWFESEKAGGRSFSAAARGQTTEVYADGKCVMAITENDGYDIDLQLLDIIDDIEEEWLGNAVDEGGNIAEYAESKQLPKFCLAASYTNNMGQVETEFYYQCQVAARPTRSGKTSEGKFEAQFLDLKLKALPRENDPAKKKLVMYKTVGNELPTSVAVPSVT